MLMGPGMASQGESATEPAAAREAVSGCYVPPVPRPLEGAAVRVPL